LEKIIQLHVLVDNEPKINQEYQVILSDVQSEGVRETGQAALHPQDAVAVVTIEGGNEPHGVISFALNSLDRKASESDSTIQLTIDRKFGSIGQFLWSLDAWRNQWVIAGTVQVYYDVKGGYLTVPSETTVPASPDIDFRAVSNGVVALFDGDNSAVIYIQLMEDEIPEVDEVFLVNLTRVELIEPSYSTFRPKLG
jgi:G-protein coupled receptor 98